MSFGEFLTKVAVVLTVYGAVQENAVSSTSGLAVGGALLALSFARDANLRWREASRMLPEFGFWFFVTCLLVVVPNAVVKWLIGRASWGLTFWGSVFAAGVISMFFRGFVIACESSSRWAMWFLGFDTRRLDATERYLQQQTRDWFLGSSDHDDDDPEDYDAYFEPTDSEATVVDGEIDCCPDCGEPYTDVPYCRGCAAAFPPNANDHRPRLN